LSLFCFVRHSELRSESPSLPLPLHYCLSFPQGICFCLCLFSFVILSFAQNLRRCPCPCLFLTYNSQRVE
jgi:hypothetical protein